MDNDFVESAIFASYGYYDNHISNKLGELIGEQKNKGMGISNLGKQSIENFSSFSLTDLLFIPPAFPANLITIGAMTVNGKLSLCLRYAKTEISDAVAEEICMKAVDYLCRSTSL